MALFRRTKSPRSVELRTTAGLGNGDKPSQQSEENKRKDKKGGKSFSAHRRHKSDELNSILESTEVVETPTFLSQSEEVVDVYQLSDPGPLPPLPPHLPPRHRGGSGGTSTLNFTRSRPGWRRTQSGGTTMTSSQQPPHQEYFVPADTLKPAHQRSSVYPSHNGAVGTGGPPISHHGSGHVHGGHSSSKDKRNIEMHNKIVAQNDPLQMSIKRKSRSLENLVECSDYSLPFDVVSEGHSQTGTTGHKSRSPENQLQVNTGSQKTHSDSNLHNTSTPPAKPARRTRDYNPPSFAPPPPPQGDEPSTSPDGIHHRPKTDDYEEPWNSSKFLPSRQNRRNRADTDFSRSGSHQPPTHDHHLHKPSPRSHRSHTMHHESSPPDTEPNIPGLPPRPIVNSPRLRTESAEVAPSSPQFDVHRPRTITGESGSDYCIPPDAILHDFNGISISNGSTTGQSGGGGFGEERAYVNQPPIPPPPAHRTNTTALTTTDAKKKLRYPPLLPSEYYITDIQNLPPPAFAINTSLPLEEQPWFHGRISRDQAEDILYNQPDFSFLLRKSESSRMDYSLSIRDSTSPAAQGFIHLKITQEKGGYVLGQFSAPFATVPQCISYYTQRELTIKHINHRRLGFPVGRMSNSPIQ